MQPAPFERAITEIFENSSGTVSGNIASFTTTRLGPGGGMNRKPGQINQFVRGKNKKFKPKSTRRKKDKKDWPYS